MEGDAGEDGGGAAELDGVLGQLEGSDEGVGGGGLVTDDGAAGEDGLDGEQAFFDGGVFEEGDELKAAEGIAGDEGGEVALEFDEGAEELGVGGGDWGGGMCEGCFHAMVEFGWRGRGALKVRRVVAK